jgi:hypothetical protein
MVSYTALLKYTRHVYSLTQSSVLFLLLGWHPTLCQHANDTGDVILHAAHTLIMSVLSPLSLALSFKIRIKIRIKIR